MLKNIFNIKRLFQNNETEMQIPLNTLYGSKYLLYVTNFALICIVVILIIVSASIYFFMPVIDASRLSEKVDIQEADETIPDVESIGIDSSEDEEQKGDAYTIITKRNIFSPQRKEWVVKAIKLKPVDLAKKRKPKKKAFTGKPKKIVLHGIVIAGNIRKALINNPMTGVIKKKTLYVEEGDELDGYKVISIESDRIRLDWHGEEIVVMLYSGVKDNKQAGNAGKAKAGGLSKLEYKYKDIEEQHAEDRGAKKAYANMRDEVPVNLMSLRPERSGGK